MIRRQTLFNEAGRVGNNPSGKAKKEQRFAPRRARRLTALLEIEGAGGPLACLIVDMSATGAKVELAPGWQDAAGCSCRAQTRATLYERVAKVRYRCVIVRAGEAQMALKFSAPPQLPAAALRAPKPAAKRKAAPALIVR